VTRTREPFTPTSEDWRFAVAVIKMIESFAKDTARVTIGRVARLLEHEGFAAHRSTDRLEKLSEFAPPSSLVRHTRETILAQVSNCYTDDEKEREEEPWHAARPYLARLRDEGLEVPARLRQQAAVLLDAAATIDELLSWYEKRRAVLGTRDLTNDTIVAIMREWKTRPRATATQLTAHDHAVTEGALKTALGRTAGLGRRRGNVEPLVFYIPRLRRSQVTS
jgi:hypothetical protein